MKEAVPLHRSAARLRLLCCAFAPAVCACWMSKVCPVLTLCTVCSGECAGLC